MFTYIVKKIIKPFVLIIIVLMIAISCNTRDSNLINNASSDISDKKVSPQELAILGIGQIQAGKYAQASSSFNTALKLSPSSSSIHFLNGLAYHMAGVRGDQSKMPLARQGYGLALKFDKSNWLARYYLGLLHLDNKDFIRAQNEFAEAILVKGNDPDLLYYMAFASYYSYDLETASAVLGRLNEIEPDSNRALQASAIVAAASNRPDQAEKDLNTLDGKADGPTNQRIAMLKRRIDDWEKFHKRYIETRKSETSNASSETLSSSKVTDPEFDMESELEEELDEDEMTDEDNMVVVDVVIIRTEETSSSSRGTNLLQGLNIQYGEMGEESGARRETSIEDDSTTATLTEVITIPAINYSLNIANSFGNRNEILARPTLVAQSGLESHFFAGSEIEAGASPEKGEAYTISKEIGVTLDMTPEFVGDGAIAMNVTARRTFLKPPSPSINFDYSVEVSKTEVTANVVMREGETLILSGLSEKETENIRDGTPLLQDIPLVQYAFSKRTEYSFQKSVLILITPRRAGYTYRDDESVALDPNQVGKSEEMKALRAKHLDWFKPYPNTASVFHQMQANRLYREFRTGDVSMEKWQGKRNLSDRLQDALTFLYY